jgi:hypothetical protein
VALMHTGLVHSLDAILAFGKIQVSFAISIVRALAKTAEAAIGRGTEPYFNVE